MHIRRDNQTLFMNLTEQAAQFIAHWIVQQRESRGATVPLPNANFEQ